MKSTFSSWYFKKVYATPSLKKETDWVQSFLPGEKTIAVVGLSRNIHKDSYYVARYLKYAGNQIVPVNPVADEILSEKSYSSLTSIPFPVDIINVFVRPEGIPAVVDQALQTSAQVVWIQPGTGHHPEQEARLAAAGKRLIQQRCLKADHQFLVRDLSKV